MKILKRLFCKCNKNQQQSVANIQQTPAIDGVDMDEYNRMLQLARERSLANPNRERDQQLFRLALEKWLSENLHRFYPNGI